MLNNKTKVILIVGVLILLNVMNLTAFFTQTASAFSLQGAFNKLFGGLFHKSTTSKQTQLTKNTTSTVSTPQSSPSLSSSEVPTECHIVDEALPDPKCTPGAANPSVTQDNIKDTICVIGFSKTVRPGMP